MKRRGFTLVEVSAAIALLAVCAVSFAYLVALTASERVAERTRQMAVDQVQNVLERLAIVPPEKLASGEFDTTAAESLIERSLPEGKIVFGTKKIEPDGVAFTVTVSWSDGEKRPRREIAMFRLLSLSSLPSPEEPQITSPSLEESQITSPPSLGESQITSPLPLGEG